MKKQVTVRLQDFFGRTLGLIARRYLEKFRPRVVVIAGSVGKTATTQAIATVLSESFRVRATHENYNTATGVPLSIFGEEFPVTRIGWITLLPKLWWRSRKRQDFELLVLEIGTDHPGEIAQFAYLRPELGVVTAVAPEHMEYFGDLDTVAAEELSISGFCQQLLVNRDMVRAGFIKKCTDAPELFGEHTDYEIMKSSGSTLTLKCGSMTLRGVRTHLLGSHSLHGLLAAAAVAKILGMDEKSIRRGLQNIKPIPGRMQLLEGKKHGKIIDDTYNSSPHAAIAALSTLYELPGKQRIALLGSMNELGKAAPLAHRTVGQYCDATKLDLVITLGELANTYIARAARQRGCEVIETQSPYEAGKIIMQHLKSHAIILAKGSQNGVFAEEAVKPLLKNWRDRRKLVRQTPYWLAIKRIAFSDAPN